MKRLLPLLLCICAGLVALPATVSNAQQTFKTTTETVIGLLQYVPTDYNSNSNKYPLVIFLHGIGERGANSTDPATLESTIHLVDNLGPPRHVKDGHNFPFVLISPQLKNNYSSFPLWYILEVLNWAKKNYRIDEKRIHITGLSMGGGGAWAAIQDYPRLFASSAPLCAGYNSPSKACNIAAENVPVWAFHGDADTTVPLSKTTNMVNAINACSPTPNPKAKVTIYPGVKHDAWTRAYRPDHTYHNPNVYEWMMAQVNTKNGGNSIPTANAGADKSFSGVSKITLYGSGTDADGSIASYSWSKLSGPSATFSNASAASTSVSVTAGTYMFRLTVKDNSGNTDTDYVKVVVSTSSNSAPTAYAGSDATITLPTSSAKLIGSGKDSDGTIASYAWSKVSGSTATLTNATTSTLTASGLVEGTYVFRLTVKDNAGASGYDDVKVTVVKSTSTTNQIPTVNGGSDITMTSPASTARLYGKASDPDGTIVSYIWSKISGGVANLSNATTPDLIAWGLAQGTYVFRLTVKDNSGATAYDDVKVVINGSTTTTTTSTSSNQAPTVSAGPNLTIYLPGTTARLYGKASDPEGSALTYLWTKVSGPAANLSYTTTPDLIAWKLVAGTYVFRLTVKDSKGATSYDDATVYVK